jgi:CubicO group peptidase (beta-lactamase class C family)
MHVAKPFLAALTACCVLLFVGQGALAAGRSLSPKAVAAIDLAMQRAVDSGWIAGGAVAVSMDGRQVFSRGYGLANLETATPVGGDAVFRIGSLTKQFTAAAVLLLVQDGRLQIDDPAAKYLPELPRDDPTTLRQLLNHTSGIADYVGRPGFERETMVPHTTDQLVAYVTAQTPLHLFPPGTQWRYSSSNYILAGAIVERVSDMPLGRFLETRIFDPLGMTQTALDDEHDVVPHRATGYDRTAHGFSNARQISMTVPFAAGAIRSTPHDLLLWTEALSHGRVLKPAALRLMTTPARLNDGSPAMETLPDGGRRPVSYGMGLFVGGDPARPDLWHEGAIDGFTSHLGLFGRTDFAVAVLVNTSPNEHLPIGDVVAALQRASPPPAN